MECISNAFAKHHTLTEGPTGGPASPISVDATAAATNAAILALCGWQLRSSYGDQKLISTLSSRNTVNVSNAEITDSANTCVACNICGSVVDLKLYLAKQIEQDGSTANATANATATAEYFGATRSKRCLDVIASHRVFCPWVWVHIDDDTDTHTHSDTKKILSLNLQSNHGESSPSHNNKRTFCPVSQEGKINGASPVLSGVNNSWEEGLPGWKILTHCLLAHETETEKSGVTDRLISFLPSLQQQQLQQHQQQQQQQQQQLDEQPSSISVASQFSGEGLTNNGRTTAPPNGPINFSDDHVQFLPSCATSSATCSSGGITDSNSSTPAPEQVYKRIRYVLELATSQF